MKSMKVNVATIQASILESLEGIGSWTKLRCVVAWIILFKNKLLKSIKTKPEDTDAGMKFNVNLLNEAENIILKLYQNSAFLKKYWLYPKMWNLNHLSRKAVAYINLTQY